MSAKDGKNDPQDKADGQLHALDTTPQAKTPALFPITPGEKAALLAKLVATVRRIDQLEIALAAITKAKREEIKKARAAVAAIMEELDTEGK